MKKRKVKYYGLGTTRVRDPKGSPYKDTVDAKLAQGESVLNAGAAEILGPEAIAELNKMGLAKMGITGMAPYMKDGKVHAVGGITSLPGYHGWDEFGPTGERMVSKYFPQAAPTYPSPQNIVQDGVSMDAHKGFTTRPGNPAISGPGIKANLPAARPPTSLVGPKVPGTGWIPPIGPEISPPVQPVQPGTSMIRVPQPGTSLVRQPIALPSAPASEVFTPKPPPGPGTSLVPRGINWNRPIQQPGIIPPELPSVGKVLNAAGNVAGIASYMATPDEQKGQAVSSINPALGIGYAATRPIRQYMEDKLAIPYQWIKDRLPSTTSNANAGTTPAVTQPITSTNETKYGVINFDNSAQGTGGQVDKRVAGEPGSATSEQQRFLGARGIYQTTLANQGSPVDYKTAQTIEKQGRYGGKDGLHYQLSGYGDENSVYARAGVPGGKLNEFVGAGTGRVSSSNPTPEMVAQAKELAQRDIAAANAPLTAGQATRLMDNYKNISSEDYGRLKDYHNRLGIGFNNEPAPDVEAVKAQAGIELAKTGQAQNQAQFAETQRHNRATEAAQMVNATKATNEHTPREIQLVEYMTANGMAKNKDEAWNRLKTLSGKSQEDQVLEMTKLIMNSPAYSQTEDQATTISRARQMVDSVYNKQASKPTLAQFIAKNRPANPGVSDAALTDYYNTKYGG